MPIGSVSSSDINLPGAVLRSSAIELMGSGIGGVSFERLAKAIQEVFQAAIPGGFKISVESLPLSQVEKAWSSDASSRMVFTVGK